MFKFLWEYLLVLVVNWWTLAAFLWGSFDVIASHFAWFEGFKKGWLHKHRWRIAFMLIIIGQAAAYKELSDKKKDIPAPLTINVSGASDDKARKELEKTQKDLEFAKETIRQLDPKNEPLASATATVTVDVSKNISDKADGATNIGAGAVVMFVQDRKPRLVSSTINNQILKNENGRVRYRFSCDQINRDSQALGSPVHSLGNAELMQVMFAKQVIEPGTQVYGGEVICVLNNRVILKFDIPDQKVSESNGVVIPVKDGLATLRH